MPSPINPSGSSFPFPSHHADSPDGPGPHGNSSADGGHQPNDLPGHDGRGGGRTDNDVAENRGQLDGQGQGDGDGSDGSGRGTVGRGNGGNGGNGGPETGGGTGATPGQSGPGLPNAGGRTGGGGQNIYGNGGGSNGYGNGGANAGGGTYTGGIQTPGIGGGLGGIVGQVSQAASTIVSTVFGSIATANSSSLPHLFTEQLPHFVGDSASRAQSNPDHQAPPQPGTTPTQHAANDPPPTAPRNADATAQAARGTAADVPEGEGRGLPAAPSQAGVDARGAQVLAQGSAALAAMQTEPEAPAQLPGTASATPMEADALARALAENQNNAAMLRADGKDVAAQLRQGAQAEGETGLTQQAALSKQPTDAPDRMLSKLPAEARPAPDARVADGRMLDPRVADGRLVLAESAARPTAESNASRQAADLAKAAATTEGGRMPVAADGKANTASSSGRGLFGGTAEYTRQALDWVGQQVREFGFGASPDEDGARAMRVVAGLVVASVGVLVVIGVLYALRIIFVA